MPAGASKVHEVSGLTANIIKLHLHALFLRLQNSFARLGF